MIRSRLVRRDGAIRMEVRGHSGQAPKGQDLVCAGVSALVDTLALGLRRYDPYGSIELGDGLFRYQGTPGAEARAVIETFAMGLRDLAQTESDFVSYREEG